MSFTLKRGLCPASNFNMPLNRRELSGTSLPHPCFVRVSYWTISQMMIDGLVKCDRTNTEIRRRSSSVRAFNKALERAELPLPYFRPCADDTDETASEEELARQYNIPIPPHLICRPLQHRADTECSGNPE
jgi:hypothetical protein